MDRGKAGGRSSKNKISQPASELIALGTKNPRNDTVESKRPVSSLVKSSASSSLGNNK